jgi:hypothetical protein
LPYEILNHCQVLSFCRNSDKPFLYTEPLLLLNKRDGFVMEDEKPKLHMPRSVGAREKALEIEKHTGTGIGPLPKTHDDFLGVQHAARRHHPEHHKE